MPSIGILQSYFAIGMAQPHPAHVRNEMRRGPGQRLTHAPADRKKRRLLMASTPRNECCDGQGRFPTSEVRTGSDRWGCSETGDPLVLSHEPEPFWRPNGGR